jgi:hypothetical protein
MAIFNVLRWSMIEMASHRRTVYPIFWMLLVLVGERGIART